MNELDFIIAVRNRDNKRIQNCINSFKSIANKIYVVDYNSEKPIKVKYAEIIRVEGEDYKIWNKSHALNLGIKKSGRESDANYICTIDCDIILTPKILSKIKENLDINKVIFNTNVRRINKKYISNSEEELINHSVPWFEKGNRKNIYSPANGGIQIFPKQWIYNIGGYDEGLGIYWGSMDNRIYEQAKGTGMIIVDLNIPMFHQEHKKKKEENLPEEEQDFAEKCSNFKRYYLNELIGRGDFINTSEWGEVKPNHEWMIGLVEEWSKNIEINKHFDDFVYIAIICNQEYAPINFLLNLSNIIKYTEKLKIKFVVRNIHSQSIASMRNLSVIEAISLGCTHILQLDVDNLYPDDIIPRLLNHQKDFVCAPYNMRVAPYTNLQFKNISLNKVNVTDNICNFNDSKLHKIEGTGGAGNMIRLDVFKKIDYPYYETPIKKIGNEYIETGEDINFCRKCKKANIKIWCDASISYPHQVSNHYVNRGKMEILS